MRTVYGHLLVAMMIAVVVAVTLSNALQQMETLKPSLVAVRVDDVQDFAFRDAQLFLLRYSLENDVPLSLAIIAKDFGSDRGLVDAVKAALHSGSEVTVHGWEHENLANLTLTAQEEKLREAKECLREVLGVDATVLTPPMFSYDDDTLRAMSLTGYSIVSGLAELDQRGLVSEGILSIPATIELSDFANGTWSMKSVQAVINELEVSIRSCGYAVILTHPQEFMKDGKLDQDAFATYSNLIQKFSYAYSFTGLEAFKGLVVNH